MELKEAIGIVREFVSHWTDQKLAEVLAFAEDGKMYFHNTCTCLVGVHSSSGALHQFCADRHYDRFKQSFLTAAGFPPEVAYSALGVLGGTTLGDSPEIKQRRDTHFIAILRDVIAERDRARQTERERAPDLVCA